MKLAIDPEHPFARHIRSGGTNALSVSWCWRNDAEPSKKGLSLRYGWPGLAGVVVKGSVAERLEIRIDGLIDVESERSALREIERQPMLSLARMDAANPR